MTLCGLAPSYSILALFLLITGLSSAVFHAVAPVIAGDLSGRQLGKGMGFWMVGGELGRTLGPIIIVTALQYIALSRIPWLMSAGFFASIILYFQLKNLPAFHLNQKTEKQASLLALKKMKPIMIPVAFLIIMRSLMQNALTIYLPMYLTEKGVSLWFAGASLSILEAAGAGGALLGGTLSDKLGRRQVLLIAMTISSLFMFLFLMIDRWVYYPFVLLILGFTLLSMEPIIMALVQESFPQNRALANGTYMCLNFLIRSLAAFILGILGDLFGLQQAFFISAIIMLIGIPSVFLLPKEVMKIA